MKTEIVKPVLFDYATDDVKLVLNILRVAARLKEFRYNRETKEEFHDELCEIFDNRNFRETMESMCEDCSRPNMYLSQFAPVITEFWNKLPSLFKFLEMGDVFDETMGFDREETEYIGYEFEKKAVPRRKKGELDACTLFYALNMLILANGLHDSYEKESGFCSFEEMVVENGVLIEQLSIAGGREEFESYLEMCIKNEVLSHPFADELELLKTNLEKVLRCAHDNSIGDFDFEDEDEDDFEDEDEDDFEDVADDYVFSSKSFKPQILSILSSVLFEAFKICAIEQGKEDKAINAIASDFVLCVDEPQDDYPKYITKVESNEDTYYWDSNTQVVEPIVPTILSIEAAKKASGYENVTFEPIVPTILSIEAAEKAIMEEEKNELTKKQELILETVLKSVSPIVLDEDKLHFETAMEINNFMEVLAAKTTHILSAKLSEIYNKIQIASPLSFEYFALAKERNCLLKIQRRDSETYCEIISRLSLIFRQQFEEKRTIVPADLEFESQKAIYNEVDQLKKDLEDLKKKRTEEQAAYRQLYSDYDTVDRQYEHLKCEKTETDNVNKILYETIAGLADKLNDIEADNEQLKDDNKYLRQDLDSMTDHFNDAEADNEQLKDDNKYLRQDLDSMTDHFNDVKADNDDLKNKYDELLRQFTHYKNDVQYLVECKDSEIAQLKKI